MVLSVSTTPPYKMPLHDVLRVPKILFDVYNPILGLLEFLTKRRALQNAEFQIYNFGFSAILLQNALVRGHLVITKCPIINHL